MPSPMRASPWWAVILKYSLRPSIFSSTAVAFTVEPMGEGLICDDSMCPPTVVLPSGRHSFTAFIAAFSMSAIMAGVASTGMSPEPRVMAVWVSSTVNVLVYDNPISRLNYYYFKKVGAKLVILFIFLCR